MVYPIREKRMQDLWMMELSCLNYSTRYEDSETVAEANARVPDAEHETLL